MTNSISYEIQGTNRVRNQLRTAAAMYPEISNPIIGKHAKSEQKRLRNKPYPPKPANSTYVRKRFFGGIAGSFSARQVSLGKWSVKNSRPYAGYVIGKKQAWMHIGRWWQMDKELQGNMPSLTKSLSIELEKRMDNA